MESEIILKKLEQFCAYQERCTSEVISKLKYWKIDETRFDSIIARLKEENFLDEVRFAKAYAHGQFRLNKWGKRKILFELNRRSIPDTAIREGLADIDEEEYRQVLTGLITRKNLDLKNKKSINIRGKIINFVQGKGYEMELILEIINELKI